MMEHNSETSIGKSSAKAKGMISILNRVIILKQTQKSGSEVQSTKALSILNGKVGLKSSKITCKKKREF